MTREEEISSKCVVGNVVGCHEKSKSKLVSPFWTTARIVQPDLLTNKPRVKWWKEDDVQMLMDKFIIQL